MIKSIDECIKQKVTRIIPKISQSTFIDLFPDSSQYIMDKNQFYGLLVEALAQIPTIEKQVICDNLIRLQAIDYNYFLNQINKMGDDPSRPDLDIPENNFSLNENGRVGKKDNGCDVLIDLSKGKKIVKATLGHEFAHVFYNHPVAFPNLLLSKKEDCLQHDCNEYHARKISVDGWGFDPLPYDMCMKNFSNDNNELSRQPTD